MQTNSAARSGHDDDAAGVTVACVDDDTLIRLGFADLVPGLGQVLVYERLEPLLADPPDVDVVVLDLWLHAGADPDSEPNLIQGARAVEALHRLGYRVLVYTNERRRHVLAGCLAAGALGIVHKSEPMDAVAAAIRTVAAGGGVVTSALAGLAEAVERRGELPTLSPRQLEVLRGRARGESFKAIGARLYISPKTAEAYMGEVSKRFADYLQSHSPADLENHLGVGIGDLLDPDVDVRAVS
ncbi:MAG: response regulator transcription factor [Dermatophilus congolensis]|nr:response regulator transcription factor [Dermatophilus congolensis]